MNICKILNSGNKRIKDNDNENYSIYIPERGMIIENSEEVKIIYGKEYNSFVREVVLTENEYNKIINCLKRIIFSR